MKKKTKPSEYITPIDAVIKTPSRYKSINEGKAHYSRLAYQQSCILSPEEIEEMRIQGEKEK